MTKEKPISELSSSTVLVPKEQSQRVSTNRKELFIGIPREVSYQENRVPLTPDAVSVLVKNGHRIRIETNAGAAANFTDSDYSEAGAEIVASNKEAFAADIILKIEPLVKSELDLLKTGQTLVSTLNIPSLSKSYFDTLLNKRITCIGFEFLEDKAGDLPIVRAMSEIAGSSAVLIASEYLSKGSKGIGVLLGGITGVPPCSVVIIGAGTVAEYAARTALGLGASVKVFDTHLYRLQRLKYAVGHGIYTSIIDSETLSKALCEADVVIGAMRSEKGYTPMVIAEEMVEKMKNGSVIVDVAIDHGGCVDTSNMTSHDKPTFVKHGVIHYCVPNIASRVAHTASIALSNIFTPILIKAGNLGGVEEMILSNQWFMKGVYAYKGNVTNIFISKKYGLRYRELGLLLAARF